MTDIPVQDIEALIRIFDESSWDELRVVVDGLEINLSKNPGAVHPIAAAVSPADGNASVMAAAAAAIAPPTANAAAPAVSKGMIVVRAPNLGTFYRAPKPGAPPYVAVGQKVEPDTEVCLIEVMKLFTSVCAGTPGTVREILAADTQLVEFDQPLFLIEPLA